MKKNYRLVVSAILINLILLSCGQQQQDNKIQKKDTILTQVQDPKNESGFVVHSEFDKRASQIAGLDTTIFSDPATIKALKGLNENWKEKNDQLLQPIRNWVQEQGFFPQERKDASLVFYPFSGPDFEFVNAFYHEADEYILCGLEKAGNNSALIFSKDQSVDTFLKSAESYFYFNDKLGFFRTLDMEKQFNKNGVVDIISLYIKRTGSSIGNIELKHWDKETGNLVASDSLRQPDVCSFEFRFPSGKVSKLYYFSKDLSDPALQKDSLWLPWVMERSKGMHMVSLTKSASYLMHTDVFTQVRDFILTNAGTHIQDDTGISYSQLLKSGKNLKLFGKYTKVIPLFKNYYQRDLAEKYQSDSLPLLPFKIGYNLRHKETCLQVFNH